MEQIIDKLRKIKSLVDRGEAGEAVAAKHHLEKLLEKYDISIEQLFEEKREERTFKVSNKHEMVFYQICFFIIGNKSKAMWHYKGKKTTKHIDLTDIEYIDIQQLFEFHKKQYNKEYKKAMKTLELAYVHKHRLFNKDKSESSPDDSQMTLDEYLALVAAIKGLDDISYCKQLEQ